MKKSITLGCIPYAGRVCLPSTILTDNLALNNPLTKPKKKMWHRWQQSQFRKTLFKADAYACPCRKYGVPMRHGSMFNTCHRPVDAAVISAPAFPAVQAGCTIYLHNVKELVVVRRTGSHASSCLAAALLLSYCGGCPHGKPY